MKTAFKMSAKKYGGIIWLTKFPMNASAAAPALLSALFPPSKKETENTKSIPKPALNAVLARTPAPLALLLRNKVSKPARAGFFLSETENTTQIKNPQIPLRVCTPLGTRTLDTLIKSQVLYQLS